MSTDNFFDDRVTFAFVMRASSDEIKRLSDFLASGNFELIYKTTSYGPLYINRTKHDD